jgi:hypothetical protein
MVQDEARTRVAEVHEDFCRRKDKLRKRSSNLLIGASQETWDRGASFSLKQCSLHGALQRNMAFYHQARQDGLEQRTEQVSICPGSHYGFQWSWV